MIRIYGIKNCDTVKKALKWLDAKGVSYDFHDYKKSGADEAVLKKAIKAHGWDVVLNRRGTTWRQLSEKQKNNIDDKAAIKIALGNPSIIKRPLLVKNSKSYLGFSTETYKEIFK